MRSFILIMYLPPYIMKWMVVSWKNPIGTIGMPRLAQGLLTLIGSCRIYYVFRIKVCLPFNILFLKVQFALKKVLLSPIFFETLLQSCKSNRALHLCWQKIKPVPYQVSSARFISAQRWTGIGRKSARILLCVLFQENILYVCPCFRMKRVHWVNRASYTLWCEKICSSDGLWLF